MERMMPRVRGGGGREKPNYFLALRMSNDGIKQVYDGVRSRMVKFNPSYDNICTQRGALHLTLCLLSIENSSQLQAAGKALLEASDQLQSQVIPKAKIRVAGLSTYNDGRVVYANADIQRDFLVIRSMLMSFLDAAGVNVIEEQFSPHITVAKVTRAFACAEGTSVVDPRSYEQDLATEFGEETVTEVRLCMMGSDRDPDGFYVTKATVQV